MTRDEDNGGTPDGRGAVQTGMDAWKGLLSGGVNSPEAAAAAFGLDPAATARAARTMPVRINSYYASLIRSADDPLGRQVLPSALEDSDPGGTIDPLNEAGESPVPHLVHRYPDRVLMLVTYQCTVYCRFCTRKRAVGTAAAPTDEEIRAAVEYVRRTPAIRDVIVSGGDPLILPDERLGRILGWVRSVPHVEIVRVDTRAPCSLPQRVTPALCRTLAGFHPLFVNTHFNHPREVTPEAREACERLVDHGIPVGNQTVLLKGVNDDPVVMRDLVEKLIRMRVKPYYLYQCDPVAGTAHFRTPVRTGLSIMAALRGRTSGMAIPTFVIDTPGGGGKVPLVPDAVVEMRPDRVVLRNHEGKEFTYGDTVEALPIK
jgi:lysine 2,3-aminomutase